NGSLAAANHPFGLLYFARAVRPRGAQTVQWAGTAGPSSHHGSLHSRRAPMCRDGLGLRAYGQQSQHPACLSLSEGISAVGSARCPPSTPEYARGSHRRREPLCEVVRRSGACSVERRHLGLPFFFARNGLAIRSTLAECAPASALR